jgi:hypothetical protein
MLDRFIREARSRALDGVAVASRRLGWICIAASIGALSACGGGGGGGSSPPQPQLALTAQPSDLSVVDGDRADFTVQASTTASFQWQRESASGAWADIPGATASTYELPAVHSADDGSEYRVVVTSAINAAVRLTSSSATLRVAVRQTAPAIVVAPADVSVVQGQVASFSITGSVPLRPAPSPTSTARRPRRSAWRRPHWPTTGRASGSSSAMRLARWPPARFVSRSRPRLLPPCSSRLPATPP